VTSTAKLTDQAVEKCLNILRIHYASNTLHSRFKEEVSNEKELSWTLGYVAYYLDIRGYGRSTRPAVMDNDKVEK
jgi:hypothetical protein